MVIAGLVIALGEVVDDAIIDVENIARRLRLNREAADPRRRSRGAAASLEVLGGGLRLADRDAGVPADLLPGRGRGHVLPAARDAYVLAIAASLLVALVVTPAMCLLLPRTRR
jgi:multidrug efflux pump subunit AcrB